MNIYRWRQTNSYGRFEFPASNIVVEAPSEEAAIAFAEEAWGIHFNNPADCRCCGYRWANYEVELETRPADEVIEEIKQMELYIFTDARCNGEPLPLYVYGKAPTDYSAWLAAMVDGYRGD